ncbi:type ISP restriction/modification enzyme [Helicobacter pylori]
MQEISTYKLIKEKLQAIPNQRLKGSWFEKISRRFLIEHDSANEYETIELWSDWELRGNEGDRGIDMVITTTSKECIAVQCKFHQNSISYNDISPFLTQLQSGVGEVRFKKGIIISTSNLTSEALKAIEQIRSTGMGIDIDEITEEDFIYSRIDWEKFDPTKTEDEIPLCDKKKPRSHQIEAIEKTKEYFSNPKNARGKLIMACGTGKTYTSLKIMEALDPKITLFLAPSIALLSQTFREYAQEKSEPFYASIVCSDDKTGQSKNEDNDDIKFSELPLKPSTRLEDILSVYEKAQKENKRFIIFSTYQSALRIKEAQEAGLNGIDLVICDEAHRTVGAMYSSNERDDKNAFTLCHSDENIKATKRLYMTATPKVYSESSKAKAKEKDNIIYSMDDADTFGEEIYTLNFERAIALDLLTDYKVIILAVRKENLSGVTNSVNKKISQLKAEGTKLDKKLINNEFVCKIVGTHKGLAKQDLIALNNENKEDNDLKNKADTFVSQRAISFCKSIQTSKNIKDSFETIMECYDEELKKKSFKNLKISIDHIDGTMNCKVRLEKLEELNEFKPNTCKVLSNARCLSEGVDVPALDSIVFFDGKSAMVDIIQAVGRVMRKAKHKKRGYIILPIALEESEIENLDEAVNNTNFKNIWKVIKALRSHDPSLVDEATFREKIKVFGSDDNDGTNQSDEEPKKDKTKQDPKQAPKTLFDAILLQDLANAVYNVMPTKLGDRNYWENFAKKTGNIARTLNNRLKIIFEKNPEFFHGFLDSLRENIHQNIKEYEALDMIISHIITKPIFDAIFGDNIQNPIAKALDKMVLKLSSLGLEGETKDLKNLYESVKTEALHAKSQKSQQELIKNLYNTFFKEAFKKQSEKLGIVYTPIEVVDFILRATNGILKKHFNTDFNDQNITIFDPFTGTGSFIARLLSKESDLISDEALKEKFQNHLFAFDIVLLSYYIALINITQAAQNRDSSLKNFKNIALTDSLDIYEEKNDKSVQKCIDTYNADLKRFNEVFREAFKQRTAKDKGIKLADRYKHLNSQEITTDKTKIAWTDDLKNKLIKNKNLQESHKDRIRLAMYRPFNKQWLYWDKDWINRQGEFSKIFPDKDAQNVVINTGVGNGKDFSALVSDCISDLSLISHNQAYPLYYYDDLGNRYNAISGYALNLFRRHYQDDSIVEEEIFYYIYAIFHHKGYLEKYKNSLTKEAPRIALSEDFKELSMLGKELAELHLNYENGEMHTSVKHNLLENAEVEGYYDVVQMKKDKKGDRILYNKNIAITKIPQKAFDYVVNGKSAIDWVIERYSITTDKDSLIENNPNHYAGGKYVFELLCRVIKLSEKSVDLIEKISMKRFE